MVMEQIGTVVAILVFVGIGYSFLRWYLNGDERLNGEFFD